MLLLCISHEVNLELIILKDRLMNFKLLGCAAIAFGILGYYELADCGTLLKSIKKDAGNADKAKQNDDEDDGEEEESTEDTADSSDKAASEDSTKPSFDKTPEVAPDSKPEPEKSSTSTNSSNASPSQPAATPAPAAPEKPKKEIKGNPVVAKIGRLKEFRRNDVLKIMKTLPAQLTAGIQHDRLFQMCLDQLISSSLMVEQAKKAGLEKTKEYLEALEATKNDLLARQFLMKEVMPKADNETVLKARYAKYVVDFKPVKETQLFHIMVSSEKDGQEIIAKLDKGEDFKKLAKEKSLAPSKEKGGEEGYIAVEMLPEPIKGTLEKLKKNGYTNKPLEAGNAWHIFKIGDTRNSTHKSYEETKDSLKQVIVQEEIMKLIARLMKQFNVTKFNEDGSPLPVEQSDESKKAAAEPASSVQGPASAAAKSVAR